MTTAADLQSASALCDAAAQAALQQQQALGPRPQNPAQAEAWTRQNGQLQDKISALDNLSSSLAAQAVSAALDALWPDMKDLAAISASAQADIAKIADVSLALTRLAAVIGFGVALTALAAKPTPDGAAGVVSAFNAMKASLSAGAGAADP